MNQVTVRMSEQFHEMLSRVARLKGQTVEEFMLEATASWVNSWAQELVGDFIGIDPSGTGDEKLLALAQG